MAGDVYGTESEKLGGTRSAVLISQFPGLSQTAEDCSPDGGDGFGKGRAHNPRRFNSYEVEKGWGRFSIQQVQLNSRNNVQKHCQPPWATSRICWGNPETFLPTAATSTFFNNTVKHVIPSHTSRICWGNPETLLPNGRDMYFFQWTLTHSSIDTWNMN